MRLVLFAIIVASFALSVPAVHAGTMAAYWSNAWGELGADVGRSVAVDGAGNVIVTGSFEGTIDFGGGLVSAGDEDIFLVKFNPYGAHLWSMSFGSTGGDQGVDVAVDNAGSIFVTGYFEDIVEFGGGALVSNGGRDIFVVKFSFDGTHMWSRSYGSSFGNDEGHGIAVDGAGNVIVGGEFGNT
ncbi:MAG: hypothetical protein OEY69_05035, partial [Candidatus Krumholzibacteria bacterium]|nr:hypothetical protein [Candidatus Krumholzibacteria bacterium]